MLLSQELRGRMRFLGNPHILLILLTALILGLKLYILPNPWPKLPPEECTEPPIKTDCGLIFDEAHYVPAVRKMMRGEAVNNEHPPLSKALILAGILLFGDNPWGWRLLITLCGALSIYFMGRVAHSLTRSWKTGLMAAAFLAFDISAFNLSSIAMLDAPAMLFSLLAAYLFLENRLMLSGLAMGLALSSKTSSAFVLISLLAFRFFHEVYWRDSLREALKRWLSVFEKVGFISFAVLIVSLGIYDYSLNAFNTPFEHIDYMLNYHSSLRYKEGDVVYLPLSWTNPIFPYPRTPYFVVTVTVDGREYHPVAYYGMQTPLWWMTWLVAALSAIMAYGELRRGRFPKVEMFILSWFIFTYIVYFPIAHILGRWVYPFYFYMTLPAIAIGLPRILEGESFSETILLLLLISQIIWFVVWFPVKPQWLIDFLLFIGAPA